MCYKKPSSPYTPRRDHEFFYESKTPLSFKLFQSSGSKNLLTVTSSARPFRRLVFKTKSRAVAIAGAVSNGRSLTSRSRGSPGTTLHLSKTRLIAAWPWVWIRRSVSKPNESITGINPRTEYSGVPAIGPSDRTWPLLRERTVYTDATASAGPVMLHE